MFIGFDLRGDPCFGESSRMGAMFGRDVKVIDGYEYFYLMIERKREETVHVFCEQSGTYWIPIEPKRKEIVQSIAALIGSHLRESIATT